MLVVVWIWLQFPWQRKNVTFGYVQQGRNRPYEVFPWAFMRCVCGKLAVLRAFPPEHMGIQMEGSSKAGHLSGWQEEGMNKGTKVQQP